MKKKALKAAFPYTIPVLSGYVCLGLAYGIYMHQLGFSCWYPFFMSLFIYAGSMQFLCGSILLSAYNPFYAFLITLIVNARHLFYGISMLQKYKDTKVLKPYLIFALTDETFSVNTGIQVPDGIDSNWFYFFISILNHSYWTISSLLGGVLASFIHFEIQGIEFVMTALFVVIFIEQWLSNTKHFPALCGLFVSILCLILFGSSQFIIPSMFCIAFLLVIYEKRRIK